MLGGGELSFFELISHLPKPWRPLAATPAPKELHFRLQKAGVKTVVLPLPPIRPAGLLDVISGISGILRVCRKHRIPLIYANGSRASLYSGIASRLGRIPMVWHCRIADRDLRLDPILQRLSAKIIVNSRTTANRFSKPFQKKIRVVYNGICISDFGPDPEAPVSPMAQGKRAVITVGRVSRQKRHDIALAAFETLAASDPSLHLFLIGGEDHADPGWYSTLRRHSEQSMFHNRIHWIGHEDDVRPWYRAADLMIFPAENEAFGRVVIEAMACGVPVVCAQSGGIPEIITHGETGFLLSRGNIAQLNAYAKILLDDATIRDRIACGARKRALDFSLERYIQGVSQVFNESRAETDVMCR